MFNSSFYCLVGPYHIISYHIISYHIISYHIISYHISYIISYHIISYHIISYHIISYHIISYHIISYIIYHIISYIIYHISYHISYISYQQYMKLITGSTTGNSGSGSRHRFFSFAKRLDWVWGPTCVRLNGLSGPRNQGQSFRSVKLTLIFILCWN